MNIQIIVISATARNAYEHSANPRTHAMTETFDIGFLLYPELTQLDMTGPAQVLSPSCPPPRSRTARSST